MLIKKFIRGCFCCVLALVLPVGLYQDDPDSTDFQVGIHGGGGQIASVITGCDGAERAVGSEFIDVAGEVYLRLPLNFNSPFILGARGGYWYGDIDLLTGDYNNPILLRDYSYSYFNPCIAVETEYVGMGLGVIFGNVPRRFKDGQVEHTGDVSGHIRIGSMTGFNVMFSLMESTPLASGGGQTLLVMSAPLGERVRSSVGLGVWPYYHVGFVQGNRIAISRNLALDINWRIVWTLDVTEFGASAGLVYRLRAE